MITGVGLFGTLSGVIASYFLGDKKAPPAAGAEILARLDALQREVAALRRDAPPKSGG